jgi:1-deoxy-D-xylulose-5-phosphate synthase
VKERPKAIEIGKAEVIRDGADVAIFGLGAMLPEAERLAEMLKSEGFSAAVINPRFAKPVDRDCVADFGRRCGLVITLEDHVLAGGFGSAVMETLNELELQVPVVRVGWPDAFIEHGKVESLREKYGLTAEAALERSRPYLSKMMEQVLAKHS